MIQDLPRCRQIWRPHVIESDFRVRRKSRRTIKWHSQGLRQVEGESEAGQASAALTRFLPGQCVVWIGLHFRGPPPQFLLFFNGKHERLVLSTNIVPEFFDNTEFFRDGKFSKLVKFDAQVNALTSG
jgi:hypothetical protein